MIALLKQFFADVHVIADCYARNRVQEVTITLSQDTEDLLREIRWHRVRKETV